MPYIPDLKQIILHFILFTIIVPPTIIVSVLFDKRRRQIKRFNSALKYIIDSPEHKQKDMFKAFNNSWGIEKPNELFLTLSCARIPQDSVTYEDHKRVFNSVFFMCVGCAALYLLIPVGLFLLYAVCFARILMFAAQHTGVSDMLITEFDYDTYIYLKNKYCKYGKY